MKHTQKSIVLKRMRDTGSVTRNWALRNYISRLGAIICNLRAEGMDIEAKFVDGDYVYTLKDKPKVKEYFVGGQLVSKKLTW